jgi:hypothetical protein
LHDSFTPSNPFIWPQAIPKGVVMRFPILQYRRLRISLLVLCLLIAPSPVYADVKEGQIKAALLFQFSRLTDFPPAAFTSDDAPIVIALLGDVEFKEILEKGVAGKKVGNHPVVVKSIGSPTEAKGCQLLYIAPGQDSAAAMNAVAGQPVVTVGEGDSFLNDGGMIRFMIDENKVHFQVSTTNAGKVGLKFQDKLLNVARP